MWRHNLMMAARGLIRHKLYSLINVIGLSVALTCVIFVILFVRYELSYDRWIPGTHDLYRVEGTLHLPGRAPFGIANTSYPLGVAMRDQVPGVTGMTHLYQTPLTLTHGDREFLEETVDFVDSNFFSLIRLPFIEGDPVSALSEPQSVVLSEAAARKYFGSTDPMGRMLATNMGSCPAADTSCHGETVSLRVTGIVRDLPQNTQLSGSVFIPTTSLADPDSSDERQQWLETGLFTYITLAPKVTPATALAAAPAVLDQDMTGAMRESGFAMRPSQFYIVHLTPFRQVHLRSSPWIGNLTPPGSWNTLYGVIIVGVLILLLACFNFTNLATARASFRAREIGLRKTLGATRRQLAIQFLSEAVLLALLSLVCALAMAEILLPVFDAFMHRSIARNYTGNWKLYLVLIGVATGAGLISGIYPALLLSRRRPVAALQAQAGSSRTSVGHRDVLVLMQFAVSIGLGIAALVVFRQVEYARNMSLGFHREDIVVIGNSELTGTRQEAFVQALSSNPGVRRVALSQFVPFRGGSSGVSVQVPGQAAEISLNFLPSGPDYPRTYGIALVAGRLLSASRGDDKVANASKHDGVLNALVNVAGAGKLGFTPQEIVGKTIVVNGYGYHVRIVGVLADTKVQGAHQPAAPTLYAYVPSVPMYVSVRLGPERIPQTLHFIDRTWHAFAPTVAIQRWFLNASFEELYRPDEQQGTAFTVFVVIAIFIACLGLYGLVVFTAERRTKEVGIRKVSGARTADIVRLMLWRISAPVLLANLIAWPVAYYYLHRWLDGYAYRISLNPAYFLEASAGALLIAWATVYVNTLRVARASPVHALRYE